MKHPTTQHFTKPRSGIYNVQIEVF